MLALVLSGGYEDDVADGDDGAIARNCNTKLDDKKGGDGGNKCKQGKPIKVMRGFKGKKHSKFAL